MNTDFARLQMVNQQVRGWNVYDESVLSMLRVLPRERFVPTDYEMLAFADTAIAIGHGQCMMTPTLEGRLLQALGLDGNERVLEIGTGSGFMTACLASLSEHVTSIDIYDDFLSSAEQKLSDCDINNVELRQMDAMRELPEGQFDAIAVTGSIQSFEPRFVAALRPAGRLFIVEGDAPVMQAKLVERTGERDWRSLPLFETSLAPLVHAARPPGFVF